MVSILDSGIVGVFSSIFIFLLVFALAYGFLSMSKMFGPQGAPWNAIIAVVVALFSAAAPPVKAFITFVTPWYIALFIGIFFILFLTSMFGLSPEKDFPGIIKQPRVYTWIILLAILVFVAGLGFTFGPTLTSGGTIGAPQQTQQNMQVIGGQQPLAQPGTLAPSPYAGYGGNGGIPAAGQPGSTNTGNFSANLMNTIFHPKILGLIVTIVIASITIYFLSSPAA